MVEYPKSKIAFEQALLSLDRLSADTILREASEAGSPIKAVEQLVVPALERIGNGWENGSVALSQVYMSGRICEELVNEILPPGDPQRIDQPKIAIATLEDYHVLGKRIVFATLRASGLELLDFGHGMSAESLAKRAAEERIQVLLISTLMLRSALQVKEVVRLLRASNNETRVIVGGAPFSFDEDLWKNVGADAMCHYASEAIDAIASVTEVTS